MTEISTDTETPTTSQNVGSITTDLEDSASTEQATDGFAITDHDPLSKDLEPTERDTTGREPVLIESPTTKNQTISTRVGGRSQSRLIASSVAVTIFWVILLTAAVSILVAVVVSKKRNKHSSPNIYSEKLQDIVNGKNYSHPLTNLFRTKICLPK